VFKWALMEYPYLVFGTVAALVGSGVGFYYGYQDLKYNTKTKYFSQYTGMYNFLV